MANNLTENPVLGQPDLKLSARPLVVVKGNLILRLAKRAPWRKALERAVA